MPLCFVNFLFAGNISPRISRRREREISATIPFSSTKTALINFTYNFLLVHPGSICQFLYPGGFVFFLSLISGGPNLIVFFLNENFDYHTCDIYTPLFLFCCRPPGLRFLQKILQSFILYSIIIRALSAFFKIFLSRVKRPAFTTSAFFIFFF
jgi:hypothetical protein